MNTFARSARVIACAATLCLCFSNATAQFSKPVVLMLGCVRSDATEAPVSAKVSIRAVDDTAIEITSSTSNRESGRYLVVLQPSKSYWVHVAGDSIQTRDVLISTPRVVDTEQLIQDFYVAMTIPKPTEGTSEPMDAEIRDILTPVVSLK